MNSYIYALGFFDGVHLGHQALLDAVKNLALPGMRGVVTFLDHPDTLVLGQTPGLINTPEDRELLLKHYGMDRIVALPFDEKTRSTPWRAFLEDLRQNYGAAGFVCGEDFRFGAKGAGNAALLARVCREAGLPFAIVPEQTVDGCRVSSTRIRELLAEGKMEQADVCMGHPYILTGTVIHGHQLGRTLGIPTANLAFPKGLATPKFGVYGCTTYIDGKTYLAVTNLGTRPTVEGRHITVEPWILDYEGDLYGRTVTLEFHCFLRPERKFSSLEELKTTILGNAQELRDRAGDFPCFLEERY